MDATTQKRNGVHYTPTALAHFLAARIVRQLSPTFANRLPHPVQILDPACGDGELLIALIKELPFATDQIAVSGFEMDSTAAKIARRRLRQCGVHSVRIATTDFLQSKIVKNSTADVDIVIANPPYVRTQVLGGRQAQALAKQFGLTGRVDLYQAFAIASSRILKPGGVLGILTSNRFLTVKSGAALREMLVREFELKEIFDLGDTKLFDAAVLPVILSAIKRDGATSAPQSSVSSATGFHRVYLADESVTAQGPATNSNSVLESLSQSRIGGLIETGDGRYTIERGQLLIRIQDSVWSLSNAATRDWMKRIRSRSVTTFDELAEIKVGIKTTADAVFIRDDWESLPREMQPEPGLLRDVITHHGAKRWCGAVPEKTRKRVLYPYDLQSANRVPIGLAHFPRAAAYLQNYYSRLAGRKYLIDAGRRWYEIWVPHQPSDWTSPKIVWPDISTQPRFFLDVSGSIVNGDCYWIKLREGVDPEWIYLMLAVANSSIATKFYDTVFHNKLYSGRRRYMTQYVKAFPLPALDSEIGQQIVSLTRKLTKRPSAAGENKLEELVQTSFA